MLFGSAFFLIPGMGPFLIAGPLVGWVVGALEGAVVFGGLSALGAGLISLGIPKDSVVEYEVSLKGGKFLVVAHGTQEQTDQARALLAAGKPEWLDRHRLSPVGASTSAAAR